MPGGGCPAVSGCTEQPRKSSRRSVAADSRKAARRRWCEVPRRSLFLQGLPLLAGPTQNQELLEAQAPPEVVWLSASSDGGVTGQHVWGQCHTDAVYSESCVYFMSRLSPAPSSECCMKGSK